KNELTTFVDQLYSKFLSRVAGGRGSNTDEIHEVAQGRVWTGASAYENGLVDELGDLEKAIELAADMADIAEDYKINEYPKIKKDIFEELMMELMKQQNASMVLSDFDKKLLDDYNKLRAVFKFREPMARLPFTLECK
ncbi:MAG: S49 family peptidase, partial [Bacteroidia bacterium]|nr:S49 family peptidase [Bacteroidia bacterium]